MSPRAAALEVERLVLLVPIEPAATGNGLAMRADLFRRSAPGDLQLRTVVVPVAGSTGAACPAGTVIVPIDTAAARAGVRALAADERWRDRLARVQSLPALSRAASPGLADAVAAAIGSGGATALHVMRAYMAPLGVVVAERIDAVWTTLDLDEDDAAFARAAGDLEGAAAYERLLDVFGTQFDGLSAASAEEAAAIGGRHRLTVQQLPNAVPVPVNPTRGRRAGGRSTPTLLFVGNLTYLPNLEAVDVLVKSIRPLLAQRLGRRVRVRLVGRHDGRLDQLRETDVEVAGFVSDLESEYASADAVVLPLRSGAGTRIKLLEAFAHAVPVVASSVAAAGLDVTDGRHLLLADDPERAAAAIEALLSDDPMAARLAHAAFRLVAERYSVDGVVPIIREFFERAAAGAGRHPVSPRDGHRPSESAGDRPGRAGR